MADRVVFLRALDANGDPVAGALAYSYLEGTSEPADLYTDETLTVMHPWPLVADGNGAWPAAWTANGIKLDITTSDGTSLPGFPSDKWHLTSSRGTAASAIAFTPITGNPATDVQTAIATVTDIQAAQSNLGRTLIGKDNAADMRLTLGLTSLATVNILDEDDFATDSPSRPPSQQSTKAYIAAQIAAGTAGWAYTSGLTAFTADSSTDFSHGLGATPGKVQVDLVAAAADGNFASGSRIPVATSTSTDNDEGLLVYMPNATTITVAVGSALQVIDPSTFNNVGLSPSNWRLQVKASL